jgi:hypothetical protein
MTKVAKSISAGVAKSWEKKDVIEKRIQRSKAVVDGVEFRSVGNAFKELGLLDEFGSYSKAIKLRKDLKKANAPIKRFGKTWEVVASNYSAKTGKLNAETQKRANEIAKRRKAS